MKKRLSDSIEAGKKAGLRVLQSLGWGPPGLSGILFLTIFVLVLFGQSLGNLFNVLIDSDSCWLIKTGVWMVQHQAIPFHNPFPGNDPALAPIPLVCYQWLFEICLGLAYTALGLPGVGLWVAICFALSFLLMILWLYERDFKAIPDIFISVLFALLVLKSYALARPALMSLLFSVILLRSCSQPQFSRQPFWLLPLLFCLWANTHLGFIGGLLILGVFSAEKAWLERSWQPFRLWVRCGLMTLVTPYGFNLFSYFAQLANSPFMNHHIFELGSPAFNLQPMLIVYFLGVLLAAMIAFQDARVRCSEKVLFLMSFGLALYSMRHIFLLALFSLPLVAIAIEKLRQSCTWPAFLHRFNLSGFVREREKPWPWVIGLIFMGVVITHQGVISLTFPDEAKLSGIIHYFNRQTSDQRQNMGPLLSNETWGSYLLYFTRQRSYIDSRMDMYGDARVQELYQAYHLQQGWQKTFAKYHIQTLLLPVDTLQASYLSDYCRGKVLYQDQTAVLIHIDPVIPACQSH